MGDPRPSGTVVKNAKFCKDYEIYENYNSEDTYEISDQRYAHWIPNAAQNIHARTRYLSRCCHDKNNLSKVIK